MTKYHHILRIRHIDFRYVDFSDLIQYIHDNYPFVRTSFISSSNTLLLETDLFTFINTWPETVRTFLELKLTDDYPNLVFDFRSETWLPQELPQQPPKPGPLLKDQARPGLL